MNAPIYIERKVENKMNQIAGIIFVVFYIVCGSAMVEIIAHHLIPNDINDGLTTLIIVAYVLAGMIAAAAIGKDLS